MFADRINPDARVAMFLDCDNANPANLEHAVQVAQRFGRIVVRRGYGNHATLAAKWQKVLMQNSFSPCLQFQYAAGKNTADIALAIDVMEVLLEKRADTFVLVTSDSDFVGLAQKIKERGASVHIVGEVKTPDGLRKVCDQFFECAPPAPSALSCPVPFGTLHFGASMPRRSYPSFVVTELGLVLQELKVEKITLASFGSHLKSVNPSFTPQLYGHEKLSAMLKGYSSGILLTPDGQGNYWVSQPRACDAIPEPTLESEVAPTPEATLNLGPNSILDQIHPMVEDARNLYQVDPPHVPVPYAITL